MPAQLLIGAAGAAWLLAIRPHVAVLVMLGPLALIGTAIGLSFGQLDNLAISSVPPERAGMAAGMFNTTRIGGETGALHTVAIVLVAICVGAAAGAAVLLRDPRRPAASTTETPAERESLPNVTPERRNGQTLSLS